jgi:hypothetical protein
MPNARHNQYVGDSHGRRGYIRSIVGHVANVVWQDGSTSKVPTDSLHSAGGKPCAVFFFGGIALSLGLITGVSAWIL